VKTLNWKDIAEAVTLMATLLLGFTVVQLVMAPTGSFGPRSPELKLIYFGDETALYSALKARTIDISLEALTAAQYLDAITDPDIILNPVDRLDLRAWSLNNNDTIAVYPGVRSPTSYDGFRKALWRLSAVDYYTEVICGGFATPVYVPVAAPTRAWVNTTVEQWVKDNLYFSVQGAADLLDDAGFVQNSSAGINPYHNPSVQGSARYWRTYPPGHSKQYQKIDPIVFSARIDDGQLFGAGVHLRDRMLESGIPVNFIPESMPSAYLRVILARNYHIHSSGWSVGRFATYQYGWLHTSRWMPGGSNYHVATTSPGYITTPGSPDNLDEVLEKIWFPMNLGGAIAASKDSQRLSVQKYTSIIPLWSRKAFYAYRNLYGVVNMDGFGQENIYTFLNAWRADGAAAIRAGLGSPPTQVNQIYSTGRSDIATMSQTMDDFMSMEPYNVLNDQPWLAQDWTTAPGGPSVVPGTWFDLDDRLIKSVMRYWFRDDPNDGLGDTDAEWIKPVTGAVLADFTPQWLGGGYEFNSWYFDTEPAGALYTNYRDIKHIVCNLTGKYADVYFDVLSYWSQYWPYGRHIYSIQTTSIDQTFLGWKQSPLSTKEKRTFSGPIANGTFLNTLIPNEGVAYKIPTRAKGTPVEVINMTLNGFLLEKASTPHLYDPSVPWSAHGEYSIVGGTLPNQGPRIRVYDNIPAGMTLTVYYWARGDPRGYWPGNLGFQNTLAGTGPFYMTDYSAGAGGCASYKANPNYFMETPLLGEIDWYWNYYVGPQARDGYYRIDLYDAVIAGVWAYGGTGSGSPPPPAGNGPRPPTWNWVSATDLAPPLGETNIFDMAVLAVNFFGTFGSPYPNPPPPPP